MNQLQYLGTHNSYHIQPRADVFELLLAFIPEIAPTLAYTHVPLQEQFELQGIRQIELDVFHDPEGGLYANHQGRTLFGEMAASGIAALDDPGLKVLHVQEIDYETTCYTFVLCLQEIKIWSDANPTHLPIAVLVETKDEAIDDHASLAGRVLFTDSEPGTAEAAFMKRNNPQAAPGEIEMLVQMGYMVRTRADADTEQARSGDISRREAALSSGAHFISTDYPVPNLDFSDYQVAIPGGSVARCNPVNTGQCTEQSL